MCCPSEGSVVEAEILKRVEELEALCLKRGWTLGLAESCTGGLLSTWICSRPGVSKFFLGAVVSYARSVKESVLQVPGALTRAHGEVSLPVARAMASGARQALGCDWAVSVTGIAGPTGGSPEKPVGTVCFAVVGPAFENVSQQVFPAGGGDKTSSAKPALFAFRFSLKCDEMIASLGKKLG
ncbi:MAG: CinA family protein [Calothrix sp. SM1_5_4]|nr:CinA family protein [Calothrix sp. SM1_5_4]